MPSNMPREHPDAAAKKLTCGQCQWFAVGYEGKACKETRQVEIATPACIEFSPKLTDYLAELCRDKYLQGIREKIKTEHKFVVAQSVVEEMWGFTVDEDLKNFTYGTRQSIEGAARALTKCVSFRSRVSQLYTALLDINHDLEGIENEAWFWMNAKYKLIRELKNEALRTSAFNRIFPEVNKLKTNIAKGIATAKVVDDNLIRNEISLRCIIESASNLIFSKDKLSRN